MLWRSLAGSKSTHWNHTLNMELLGFTQHTCGLHICSRIEFALKSFIRIHLQHLRSLYLKHMWSSYTQSNSQHCSLMRTQNQFGIYDQPLNHHIRRLGVKIVYLQGWEHHTKPTSQRKSFVRWQRSRQLKMDGTLESTQTLSSINNLCHQLKLMCRWYLIWPNSFSDPHLNKSFL